MRRLTALAAAFALGPAIAAAQSLNDPTLLITPWLTGFSQPTGMRFFGPERGFAIEKATGLVRYFDGDALTTALDLNVQSNSERGLLGITLAPAFSGAGGHVYLYYSRTSAAGDSSVSANWHSNQLTRYTWNGSALVDPLPLATFGAASDGQATGPNHNGGPLAFGPDGKLYGATGDLNRNRIEQNATPSATSALAGGIYRLNPDGSIPTDNPFAGNAAAGMRPWYAYGVRNSFGLAFDPVTGKLWMTENGPGMYDEINQLGAGDNSGWSKIMGPDARTDFSTFNAPGDLNQQPGSQYEDPKFSIRTPVGITSLGFLHGSSWGDAYDDGVLVGDNNTGNLYLLRLNAARDGFVLAGSLADLVADGTAERNLVRFGQDFSVTTDIQVGPDGAVYVTSLGDGTIYRIAPVPEASTWGMLALGLPLIAGLAHRTRRQRRD